VSERKAAAEAEVWPSLRGLVRLQRVLARAGIASRRQAEGLILAGRVRVNGRVIAELGTRVDPARDDISVDGHPVRLAHERTCLALHKPAGVLTTVHDPQGRPTVMSLVPPIPGLVPVGRLDAESEGLLLLTTDGDWAQRVSHPRYGSTKEYYAEVQGVPTPETLARLRAPMELAPGERTSGAAVVLTAVSGGDARLRIVLREGRNRQIRRMLDLVGHAVRRLVRVRVGGVRLGRLHPGEWRDLSRAEVASASGPAAAPPVDVPSRRRRASARARLARGTRAAAAWRRAAPA
jgi:pseudouridine synthase